MSSRSLLTLGLPRTTLSALTRNGYSTVQDLSTASVEGLARELNVSKDAAEAILSVCLKPPGTQAATMPLTQSAAQMAGKRQKFSSKCSAVDKLLRGGLSRGHILEISGPPGSPKDLIARNLVASVTEAGEEVIFVDLQHMNTPATLYKTLAKSAQMPPNFARLLNYKKIHTLADFMIFIHTLPQLLETYPTASLLVICSISFPFQSSGPSRNALLERVKQTLTKASASRNLTIITTSQLATKFLNANGSPGTFDTGAIGIMAPQLGTLYLPSGRTHRIILAPDGPQSGVAKLLSSPSYNPEQGPPQDEQYSLAMLCSSSV